MRQKGQMKRQEEELEFVKRWGYMRSKTLEWIPVSTRFLIWNKTQTQTKKEINKKAHKWYT